MFNNYPSNMYYQQPRYQQPMEYMQQPIQRQNGLQGKVVDSIDVVKAMEIPLDGTISYYPLSDGSGIVTKKLLNDGTSQTIIYKPVQETDKNEPKFVTNDEFNKFIKKIDIDEFEAFKDDLEDIKSQLKELKKTKKKDE